MIIAPALSQPQLRRAVLLLFASFLPATVGAQPPGDLAQCGSFGSMEITGIEGLLMSIGLLILPFIILVVLVRLLPTRRLDELPAAG